MLQQNKVIKDRYQLETILGKRPARETWLARDLQANDYNSNHVVIKFLAFGGQVQWEDLKLFEREAQILKELDRDYIPKYCDYFSIDDKTLWFCLVEQYIPGNSLQQLLQDSKRFTESEVKKIAEQLLKILIYLHQLKPYVLHRDIKPSNIILGEDEQVYLVDFGAVQDKAATEGASFTVVGTYGYTPMEQFGGRATPQSDLYALGATLIHLLTGTPPADLPQKDLKIQFQERINISKYFSLWLSKMTEPALGNRFKSASDALDSLILNQPLHNNQIKINKPKNSNIKTFIYDDIYQIFLPTEYLFTKIIVDCFNLVKTIIFIVFTNFMALCSIAVIFLVIGIFLGESLIALSITLGIVIFFFAIIILVLSKVRADFQFKTIEFKLYNYEFIKFTISHKVLGIPYYCYTHKLKFKQFINLLWFANKSDISSNNIKLLLFTKKKNFFIAKNLTKQECDWLMYEINHWLDRQ